MRVSLIFCHGTGRYARLIQFAQRRRNLGDDARWNHVAVLVEGNPDLPVSITPTVIEAKSRGVVCTSYAEWRRTAEEHELVPVIAQADDHAEMALFVRWCANRRQRYDWLSILTIAVHLVTGGTISVGLDGTEICSGLAARMLERRGDEFETPATVMPAQLRLHLRHHA